MIAGLQVLIWAWALAYGDPWEEALRAMHRRCFLLVTYCTAGFTELLIVSDMSENGCGKCGVWTWRQKDVQNGGEACVFFYSPPNKFNYQGWTSSFF